MLIYKKSYKNKDYSHHANNVHNSMKTKYKHYYKHVNKYIFLRNIFLITDKTRIYRNIFQQFQHTIITIIYFLKKEIYNI